MYKLSTIMFALVTVVFGMRAFVLAQDSKLSNQIACGTEGGACCKNFSTGPQCVENVPCLECLQSATPPHFGVPFPGQTCNEINNGLGCLIPVNDLCADAIYPLECQDQQPLDLAGTCSISAQPPNYHEVCDLTAGLPPAHNCYHTQATCVPVSADQRGFSCFFQADNRLAQTDGPGASVCDGLTTAFEADVWYRYIAPCTGYMTVSNCREGPLSFNAYFDSMLEVFGDHTPICTPCPIGNSQSSLECRDDGCEAPARLRTSVVKNACYTIRLGGWASSGDIESAQIGDGYLEIGVVCDPIIPANSPLSAPSPHDRRKNRYLSFVPNNGTKLIAFRVDKLNTPSGSCWVGPPDATGSARCQATPTYRAWTESVIHVGDCIVSPVADFHIVGVGTGGIPNPNVLHVSTIPLPALNAKLWGDLVGTNNGLEWTPPNQFTNVNDVLAILAFITSAAVKPTFQQANLQAISSTDPCLNNFVNTADILAAVKAVAGDPYPFTNDPANCPVCP